MLFGTNGAHTRSVIFLQAHASYVLNVPIPYNVHGVYTMTLWAKYTSDYNGDNVMVQHRLVDRTICKQSGFLGSTQAGWPQQPDIWEHIHVEFDSGNFAPTHMRWYVGKHGNSGTLGSIFVSDLSVSGPKGVIYMFCNFANGSHPVNYDSTLSTAISSYSIVSFQVNNEVRIDLTNKNERPQLLDAYNTISLTENTETAMFEVGHDDVDGTMLLLENNATCNSETGAAVHSGRSSLESCQSACMKNSSCVAIMGRANVSCRMVLSRRSWGIMQQGM